MTSQHSALPTIVIVGGGAGGLELATRLGRTLGKRQAARIMLIDSAPAHIWKPLLHEVVSGALNTGMDEVNYFAHGYRNGYVFEYGRMQALDQQRRCVQLAAVLDEAGKLLSAEREVHYDYLVLAVGAETNDFGTPGVAQYAMQLNNAADAKQLRQRVLELAFRCANAADTDSTLQIAIIGGGATGVELAAELHRALFELHLYGANLQPERVKIYVIEGAERLLQAGTPALSAYAEQQLSASHITVMTSSRVAQVQSDRVVLQGGKEIAADLIVWAAGVKAPDWLAGLDGLRTTRSKQLTVDEYLRCQGSQHIYAIGDCAAAPDSHGSHPLPATAQVAHQQARWLAQTLQLQLQGGQGPAFVFHPKGMLVSLGQQGAVGNLLAGPKRQYLVEGRGARLIYNGLYRQHQAVLYGWRLAGLLYLGDKLRQSAQPALKLH
ncbi:NAD(P)/FAD-dependent oxidoreductase [Aquitalea sp. ASV15]|uniref:NAD(P)/FAD-dependent oxidoreductase n=1 Tax=Aquitalea sp. ASV15 TaxID=2795104 RepID=UPI0018EE4064|nr:NAD(P)/FAD-dependent oxidoreductase [Aquitalea sp. ASV15]